jgi:ABC-type multidrug transport system fused ATPase/permease subunit
VDTIERLFGDRSIVVIAHRLSSVQRSDQIVVLGKGGTLIEKGTHWTLFEKENGTYKEMYQRQNKH